MAKIKAPQDDAIELYFSWCHYNLRTQRSRRVFSIKTLCGGPDFIADFLEERLHTDMPEYDDPYASVLLNMARYRHGNYLERVSRRDSRAILSGATVVASAGAAWTFRDGITDEEFLALAKKIPHLFIPHGEPTHFGVLVPWCREARSATAHAQASEELVNKLGGHGSLRGLDVRSLNWGSFTDGRILNTRFDTPLYARSFESDEIVCESPVPFEPKLKR